MEPSVKKQQFTVDKNDIIQTSDNYDKKIYTETEKLSSNFKTNVPLGNNILSQQQLSQQLPQLCFLREIVAKMMAEMNGLAKNPQFSMTKKSYLKPLAEVLRICLEEKDGLRRSMNILIDAIFQNINAQKMIPLMNGLTSKLNFS